MMLILHAMCRTNVERSQFAEKVNNELEYEQLVECHVCKRRQHQVCELYHENVNSPFVCSHCQESQSYTPNQPYTVESKL